MEKIQQALERARLQREGQCSDSGSRNGQVQSVQSIEYTRTKSIEGHADLQRENRILSAMEHNDYADAFKILSTQVMQRMEGHQWSSLAITSVSGDEGKTTTAINLGISIAREIEYTVLLVDGNLRKPELHNYFGITPEVGLSDYLKNDIDIADVLIRPGDIDHFVILPGGDPLINSTEMLGSPKMCSLVEELKSRYPKRIVIFDMPPILNVADTVSFVPCVDCALIVVEDDMTKRVELEQAVSLMSVTNILGTVLNKARYK
ncbi:Tyrosine-protein kinase EpsD [hydrothermal vent metagenome]|uniref:Tyrosine-protein kinase EpsD n=1 Tax=hydrothermal vent metagenome TaxID=652676 RepID=A0A3B0WN70_9ZZZZ